MTTPEPTEGEAAEIIGVLHGDVPMVQIKAGDSLANVPHEVIEDAVIDAVNQTIDFHNSQPLPQVY